MGWYELLATLIEAAEAARAGTVGDAGYRLLQDRAVDWIREFNHNLKAEQYAIYSESDDGDERDEGATPRAVQPTPATGGGIAAPGI